MEVVVRMRCATARARPRPSRGRWSTSSWWRPRWLKDR